MSKPRWIGWIGIGLLGVLALWFFLSPVAKTLQAKRPSETRRAIAFQQKRAKERQTPSPPPEQQPSKTPVQDRPSVQISVLLTRLTTHDYPISTGLDIGPQHYVPMLDEAPWPDIESVHALQALADEMRDQPLLEQDTYDHFMETSEADGLFDGDIDTLTADPWLGLVAMYANFGREIVTGWNSNESYTQTQAIAQQLIEQYPDDPVGDYARLLFIHTMNGQPSDEGAPNTQQHLVDLLHGASDPLVIQAGLEELGRMEHTHEEPAIEQWLDAQYDQWPAEILEVVALGRLTHHSNANHEAETKKWMSRYADHLDQQCIQDECESEQAALNEFQARMNHRWERPANSWKTALIQHVYACHAVHPIHTNVRAQLSWDGHHWTPSPNLSICAGYLNHEIGPLVPTDVTLLIVSPED